MNNHNDSMKQWGKSPNPETPAKPQQDRLEPKTQQSRQQSRSTRGKSRTPWIIAAVAAVCLAIGFFSGGMAAEEEPAAALNTVDRMPVLPSGSEEIRETFLSSVETQPSVPVVQSGNHEDLGGTHILLGTYDFGHGRQSIPWRVLEVRDGYALILSEYALECIPFENGSNPQWSTSDLRSWLNNTFYYDAFTSGERSRISSASVRTLTFSQEVEETSDYVFIPDLYDVQTYFSSNEERICYGTVRAVNQGAYVNPATGGSWWWLRDPGDQRNKIVSVNSDGVIDYDGGSCKSTKGVVRPALWYALD